MKARIAAVSLLCYCITSTVCAEAECLFVTTGDVDQSQGNVDILVNGALVNSENQGKIYKIGEVVVNACYDEGISSLAVQSTKNNAWYGSVSVSADGGNSYTPVHCPTCTIGDGAGIIVDGNSYRGSINSEYYCLNGELCELVSKVATHSLEISCLPTDYGVQLEIDVAWCTTNCLDGQGHLILACNPTVDATRACDCQYTDGIITPVPTSPIPSASPTNIPTASPTKVGSNPSAMPTAHQTLSPSAAPVQAYEVLRSLHFMGITSNKFNEDQDLQASLRIDLANAARLAMDRVTILGSHTSSKMGLRRQAREYSYSSPNPYIIIIVDYRITFPNESTAIEVEDDLQSPSLDNFGKEAAEKGYDIILVEDLDYGQRVVENEICWISCRIVIILGTSFGSFVAIISALILVWKTKKNKEEKARKNGNVEPTQNSIQSCEDNCLNKDIQSRERVIGGYDNESISIASSSLEENDEFEIVNLNLPTAVI